MMIAMWAGTAPCSRTRCSRSSLTDQTSMISASLAWMRPSICLTWSSVSFWTSFSARVLSSLGDVLELLDLGDGVGAGVADRDAAFLGELVDHLHQLLAPLLGEGRQRHPDQVALGRRIQAEIGVADRLLDGLRERLVERLHGEQPRLRRRHHRDLVDRHGAAVGLDPHQVQQRGAGLAAPDGAELPLGVLDRLVHQLAGMLGEFGDGAHRTMVPTRSPCSTRRMAPG